MRIKRNHFSITSFRLFPPPTEDRRYITGYSSYSKRCMDMYDWSLTLDSRFNTRHFMFWCEYHKLEKWTKSFIIKLCKKHKEPTFVNEILTIVNMCKESLK